MDSAIRAPQESTARLPADTAISRVHLRVADLERSLGFYRDVLRFQVLRDQSERVGLGFREGGRELIQLEERRGLARRPRRPVTTGLYHVALLLPSRPELGRALLGLTAAGYPLRGMADHAVSESLYLDDPDGNGLEIYADRPRSAWPIKDGVVQLTVDPMDVDGVVAAAGPPEAAWPGLPPETVVGHVHFTVSDLQRSLAFYCDVVGFDPMMQIPGLAAVSAGGYHHHLNLNTWAGEGAPRDPERVAGLAGWELRVPGLENRRALVDRLAAAGALTHEGRALDPDAIPLLVDQLP
jgi:catechol 2,3-dioxygenase